MCQFRAGASADSYLLSSYQSSGVVAGTGSLTLTDVQAARSSDGTIQAAFVADLGASGINADAATDIMLAFLKFLELLQSQLNCHHV